MKNRDFIINICLLIFLNLLVKPFWILGVDVGVQNRVGAEAYGVYFAVFNFTFLFNMLLDMGVTNFNNRNIARHNQLLTKHLSGIITLKLLLGVVYLVATFFVALLIGYRDFYLKILLFTAINQFLNAFILYLRSNISALLLFKTDSCLSVLDRLLMVIFCSILLWGNVTRAPFQIEWFVYCQTAAYLLTAATAFAVVWRKSGFHKLQWNLPFFAMILKRSFPFALLYLLMSCYTRLDSVMIERILPSQISAYEAGIYASAFRLLDALIMISYLFSVILLPLFSKMIKEKEDLQPILRSAFSLLFVFSTTAVILLVTYRTEIMQLLYNQHVTESSAVFLWLIPCLIPMSLTYIFGTLLTANGSMRVLNITAGIGIFVNLLLNILLIPRFHAVGAAFASLTTQSVIAVSQIVLSAKQLHLSVRHFPLWNALSFVVVLAVATYAVATFCDFHFAVSLVLLGIFALLIAFGTRLLTFKAVLGKLG